MDVDDNSGGKDQRTGHNHGLGYEQRRCGVNGKLEVGGHNVARWFLGLWRCHLAHWNWGRMSEEVKMKVEMGGGGRSKVENTQGGGRGVWFRLSNATDLDG